MATAQRPPAFPPLPAVGQPDAYYAKQAQAADQSGDVHVQHVARVGRYVTAGLDPAKHWADKRSCFCHALQYHCRPPHDLADDVPTIEYYRKLADFVRQHASREAVRVAHAAHGTLTRRLQAGEPRAKLEEAAELFFPELVGHCHGAPDWLTPEAYEQIRAIEDQWV